MKKKLTIIIVIIIAIIILKNPISLGLMYLIDFIGNITGLNMVSLIDLLNYIYYL